MGRWIRRFFLSGRFCEKGFGLPGRSRAVRNGTAAGRSKASSRRGYGAGVGKDIASVDVDVKPMESKNHARSERD